MSEGAPPKLSELPQPAAGPRAVRMEPGLSPRRGAPVHPVAALLLLLVDNLWNLADWMVVDWVITIPLSFLMVLVPTVVIQRVARRDPWMRAFALGIILGVVAAVPTSVTGTPVGLALLAWFGIDRLIGRPLSRHREGA